MTTDRDAHDAFQELRLKNPRWTWKDYDMVAATIKDRLDENDTFKGTNTALYAVVSSELWNLSHRFADTFAEDNPAFKRNLFLKACGVLQ